MIYRRIPETDLTVSSLCLGTAPFGSAFDRERSFVLLDSFFEMGGNFIDTAHVYGDTADRRESLSERTIGAWLAERGLRGQMIIGTKGAHPDLRNMDVPRLNSEDIRKDLRESLESLQVDAIDIYWLHRDDPNHDVRDIIMTMNDLVEQGHIKYFGCSNWRPQRIREAMKCASENGLKGFVGNQMMWSLAVSNMKVMGDDPILRTLAEMDGDTFEFHRMTQLTAIPYSSQARGFFTKMERGIALGDWDRRMYYNDENLRRFERCKHLALEMGRPITHIVLGYLMSAPFTTIPIIGCRTVEQLSESVGAADLVLTPDAMQYLSGAK